MFHFTATAIVKLWPKRLVLHRNPKTSMNPL